MKSMLASLYRALVFKRPLITVLCLLGLTVLAAAGLPNFKLDASADSLTLENDQSLDYFRKINKRYQSGDFLVVTYSPEAPMFSDRSLETLQSLQSELADVEGIVSINSILNVPLLYSPVRSLSEQQESTRTLMTPGVDRQMAREEFLTSPLYRDMLLSDDGKTTALQLNLPVDERFIEMARERDALRAKRDSEGLSEAEAAELASLSERFRAYRTERMAADRERVESVRDIVAGYEDRADLFLGGMTMIVADMIDFIRSDLAVFGTAIVAFVILMLAVLFRQLRFVVLPLTVCLMTVIMMLGWLSWIDWRLTVISSNFVALLLIMTLALTIHLVVRYRELHARHPEWSQTDLVLATVQQMARPCLYTALTTMVAFVSLVVSGIRPVIDFGWMMTIGLALALALAFLLLPAGLMLLKKGDPKDKGDNSGAVTVRFSRVAERYGRGVIGVAVAVALVAAYGITQLKVENRFIDYFHEDTEIYQGLSVIDKKLGGTITLDIILDAPAKSDKKAEASSSDSSAGQPDEFGMSAADDPFAAPEPQSSDDPFGGGDPFAEPEAESSASDSHWFNPVGLGSVTELHQYLESLPEVGKVQSLATMHQVAKDINGGSLNNFELSVMRKMLSDDIRGFLIDPYLSDEHNQTRISMRVKETSPELDRDQLVEKIRDYALNEVGLKEQQVQFTGLLVLYNNMLQSLFRSQILTLGAVFIGIMGMFIVLFRSVTIALISLAPNLLAASVVLGGMGLFGVPLDMMTITIAAITVGIGVDHAIHYLYRFRNELADTRDYVAAMHNSHASIGRAMYYTAVTIIVGFSILALSEFIPSIYFGLLTALAMFAAIVGSLTLLPKLILVTKPFGEFVTTESE